MLQFASIWQATSQTKTTISGLVKDIETRNVVAFANVMLHSEKTNAFVCGTISGNDGRFELPKVIAGSYILEISVIGFKTFRQAVFVGSLSEFLDLQAILIEPMTEISRM